MRFMRFDSRPESVFFVGITGGRCAGKSAFAQRLRIALGLDYCRILYQDAYYHDQSVFFDRDGGAINLDAPSSIDFFLLHKHLLQLQRGLPINVPIYDFTTHKRSPNSEPLFPANVILVEGRSILTQPAIVELLTESIFLNVPEFIPVERRIQRDTAERGPTKSIHDSSIESTPPLATYQIFDEAEAQAVIEELVDKLGIDS